MHYANSITLEGKFSTAQVLLNANIPAEEMNMISDKLVSGSQMKFVTSKPFPRKCKYTANEIKPTIEPHNEMANVVFRPNVSPICVDTKPPTICTNAKQIDEMFVLKMVPPDLSKMYDA